MDTVTFYMENGKEICIRNVEHWKFQKNDLTGKISSYEIKLGEIANGRLPYIDIDKVIAVKVIEHKK